MKPARLMAFLCRIGRGGARPDRLRRPVEPSGDWSHEIIGVATLALTRIREASARIEESHRILEQTTTRLDVADRERVRDIMVALQADTLRLQAALAAFRLERGPGPSRDAAGPTEAREPSARRGGRI